MRRIIFCLLVTFVGMISISGCCVSALELVAKAESDTGQDLQGRLSTVTGGIEIRFCSEKEKAIARQIELAGQEFSRDFNRCEEGSTGDECRKRAKELYVAKMRTLLGHGKEAVALSKTVEVGHAPPAHIELKLDRLIAESHVVVGEYKAAVNRTWSLKLAEAVK